MRTRFFIFAGLLILLSAALLVAGPAFSRRARAYSAPEIYASPLHGGCYIAGPGDCRLHVEPFTINLTSGEKLVYFRLSTSEVGGGFKTIYDFRPDLSNPPPLSGSTYTPSLVTQDFAATCGKTYSIWLEGQDTGDADPYSLGGTGNFTCPAGVP